MADILDRKMPFSLEAEMSVLGSILVDPQCFAEIAQIIKAEDFYTSDHKEIYSAMQDLFLQNKTIDLVTLLDTLVKRGIYETNEQGREYIKLVAEAVPSVANVKDYAKIVHDKALLRTLIEACAEITENAYSEQDEVTNVLGAAEQMIFNIVTGNETKGFRHVKDIIISVYEQLKLLHDDPESQKGVPSGFSDLDKVLVGFNTGDLVLIGARPGMGKTSFAMNIATSAARRTKKKVAVFSLEMSCEQIVTRMLSSEAMVDSYSLRSGSISDEDWSKLAEAAGNIAECDILVDDSTGITVTGMKAKLRREKNLGMVVIDYLQLMQSDRHIDNRVQEVSDISRNLKLMAKELGVPVICCAQLNRAAETRTGNIPQLSDLRDSGSIEQDADIVMFLYRPEYYTSTQTEVKNDGSKSPPKAEPEAPEQNIAKVIIAKNRHGATGNVELYWNGKYTRFASKSDMEAPPK